jgi:hypothetical protein
VSWVPEFFLIKLFERVLGLRFTDKVKFTEVKGGYAIFDISIRAFNSKRSVIERIQLKAFVINDFEYADIEFPELSGEVGMSTQGNIYYRFSEKSEEELVCLQFRRY